MPTCEGIARRSFGLDGEGRVILTIKLAGGDGHAVERKTRLGDVGLKLHPQVTAEILLDVVEKK